MVTEISQQSISNQLESVYHSDALRQLCDQLVRFTPKAKRMQQMDLAELLIDELVDETVYPFDFVHYRVTGVRLLQPDASTQKGLQWREDLLQFVQDVSASLLLNADAAGQKVWTVEELAKRFDVAERTINRWRQRGLAARRFRFGNRVKVGFLDETVNRFLTRNSDLVKRGGQFRNVNDNEREEIFKEIRSLLEIDPDLSISNVTRSIAQKMTRSPETIRMMIKDYDRMNPEKALFPDVTGPLADATKLQIHNLNSRGVGIAALARQFRRSRQTIHRVLIEVRAMELLKTPLDFIDNPEFANPGVDKEFLAEMPEPETTARKQRAPKDLPPYLASLYEVPLLTRQQEQHLFRKMNYLKWKAMRLREKTAADVTHVKASDLDLIEKYQEESLVVKNQIIRANLRLVVSIAKRHVGTAANFFELISDGNMSLMRAVEKFDFARGNKFSTYASWAIVKNYARSIPEESHHRDRFVTGHEEMFEAATDSRMDEQELELAQKTLRQTVRGMLDRLDARERLIIERRFGLSGGEECTLESRGRELGITKERVRQIEARAQEKIRRMASQEQIEMPNR
jgi:RNA polymerase primary sigma factor